MMTRYEPGGVVFGSMAVMRVEVAVVTVSGALLNRTVGVRPESVKPPPDNVNTCVPASYVALLMMGNDPKSARAVDTLPTANTHTARSSRQALSVIEAFD